MSDFEHLEPSKVDQEAVELLKYAKYLLGIFLWAGIDYCSYAQEVDAIIAKYQLDPENSKHALIDIISKFESYALGLEACRRF